MLMQVIPAANFCITVRPGALERSTIFMDASKFQVAPQVRDS